MRRACVAASRRAVTVNDGKAGNGKIAGRSLFYHVLAGMPLLDDCGNVTDGEVCVAVGRLFYWSVTVTP